MAAVIRPAPAPPADVPLPPQRDAALAMARTVLEERPELLLLNAENHDDLVAAAYEMRQEKAALREYGQWLVEQGHDIVGLSADGTTYEIED